MRSVQTIKGERYNGDGENCPDALDSLWNIGEGGFNLWRLSKRAPSGIN